MRRTVKPSRQPIHGSELLNDFLESAGIKASPEQLHSLAYTLLGWEGSALNCFQEGEGRKVQSVEEADFILTDQAGLVALIVQAWTNLADQSEGITKNAKCLANSYRAAGLMYSQLRYIAGAEEV